MVRKKGTSFSHVLYVGGKGICQGFHDKGGFFGKEKTKQNFENKISIPSEEMSLEHCGSHVGVEIMYEKSDLIRVDREKEIVYCVHTFTS